MSSVLQIQNASRSNTPNGPPTLSQLADPPVHQMDTAAMDYFLIEMVNTLRESSSAALKKQKEIEKEMLEAGLIPPTVPAAKGRESKDVKEDSKTTARDSTASLASKSGGKTAVVDEEEEALRVRLEAIGMHVGANFSERLTLNRGLFSETLDAIKFICKDLWAACWDKQVDNLRTNHRGVYVLQDNTFKPISRISSWEGRTEAIRRAKIYTAMPAGIIRGALARMGHNSTITPEVTSLPQCTFQVRIHKGT
ncbi:transport protein particle component [Cyathus striatus]|nr:transport protein particle component [Cyathus striatus]